MIEKHDKVFVPVSNIRAVSEHDDNVVRMQRWSNDDMEFSFFTFAEEKENVYVLTERELKKLILEYSKELAVYYDFAVMPDRIYEPRIKQFLQSKTNPQTENKNE